MVEISVEKFPEVTQDKNVLCVLVYCDLDVNARAIWDATGKCVRLMLAKSTTQRDISVNIIVIYK